MAAKFVVVAIVVALLAAVAASQTSGVPSCAAQLASCANYLNSTSPPESCCGPLKEAVKNELPCLCSLFNSPDLLKAFQINLTQALQLPKHCGIKSNQSICSKTGASSPPTSTPAAPAGGNSSSSGSGSPAKKDSSDAFRGSVWIGNTVFMILLGFGWTIMAL